MEAAYTHHPACISDQPVVVAVYKPAVEFEFVHVRSHISLHIEPLLYYDVNRKLRLLVEYFVIFLFTGCSERQISIDWSAIVIIIYIRAGLQYSTEIRLHA